MVNSNFAVFYWLLSFIHLPNGIIHCIVDPAEPPLSDNSDGAQLLNAAKKENSRSQLLSHRTSIVNRL